MTFFKHWNKIIGWSVFTIAAAVYLITMEPVSSMWDCSEFIATSYKLEVGHPPGAPLFMLLARIATIFAPSVDYVPTMVNGMNSIASAFCILFLFWSITHLARKIYTQNGEALSKVNAITSLGAGLVGALAYTFTDTFWFSAIEGEVYALSSMFTALVFWLMLKWEEQADEPHANRWIILIAYLMGLSIGVHILNLLTIPALVLIYYFRKSNKVTAKGLVTTMLIAGAILVFVNNIIIPYTVAIGAEVDYIFVNVLGLPVNSGMVVFSLALIGGIGYATWKTHLQGKVLLNTILLCTTMILIGFSSYATITIRAVANPPMNSNNPNNPYALLSMLNRDQYGSKPLLYGAQYSAPATNYKTATRTYLGEDGLYKQASEVVATESPEEFKQLFPRMWNGMSRSERDYKPWAAYRTKLDFQRDKDGNVLRDQGGKPIPMEVVDYGRKISYGDQVFTVPTFGENLKFFFSYQLNYMYWRYFLWNFVGRQNDIQASSSTITDGNWLSGVKWIDEKYVGPQDNLPREIEDNKARNTYFFLPFILGLIGLIYQLNRDQRNFSIVMLLFIMTGIALVVYFNSSPGEPRERDYVYAGSFYAFCIWIGFGVLAIKDLIEQATKRNTLIAPVAATIICLSVPTILAAQNWDDHDRSGREYARDIGWNYLQSTLPNSIIINYGDNDTFPLWNNQEVYGVRTDVRIMNSSYLGASWYIDEMKTKANEAAGVPFSLPSSKYTYTNDFIPIEPRIDRAVDIKEIMDFIRSDDPATKLKYVDGTETDYIPTKRIALPVNKENAIASGIVREQDRDLIVDTIFLQLDKRSINRSDLMLLDMLANFDWKRPIYMTQFYIFQNFGLLDYLQFDGYAYRFVPIYTKYKSSDEAGRIDIDYTQNLLENVFKYGNVKDPNVYADHFTQYNIAASKARESYARTAKELINNDRSEEAIRLLDKSLVEMPISQIRFTDSNTFPLIEGYYAAGVMGKIDSALTKGDQLLLAYAESLIEHTEYYLQFEGTQGDMVNHLIDANLDALSQLYYLAGYNSRTQIVNYLNDYYRSMGVSEESLMDTKETTPLDKHTDTIN